MKMYKDWAEFYDLFYEVQRKDADIPFLLKLVRESGGPVLECACGTGRVMLQLAKAGFEVHGIDISGEMLAILEKKLGSLPGGARKLVSYEKKDIRDFEIGRKFRTCIIAFTSLYHLESDAEMRKFLKCVRRHLVIGGVLIIDVFDFDPQTPQGVFRLEAEVNDRKGRKMSKYGKTVHGRNQVNDVWFKIVVEDGGRKRVIMEKFKLHYLLHDQMWKMLETAGFKVMKVYGNYNSEPYYHDRQNERMIFVARKQKSLN
jgi:ubiquinone/menaquinone biosynthesis C-methylase UbiE